MCLEDLRYGSEDDIEVREDHGNIDRHKEDDRRQKQYSSRSIERSAQKFPQVSEGSNLWPERFIPCLLSQASGLLFQYRHFICLVEKAHKAKLKNTGSCRGDRKYPALSDDLGNIAANDGTSQRTKQWQETYECHCTSTFFYYE